MYLKKFVLPIHREEAIVQTKMEQNGGAYGYVDNPYPCGLFYEKRLKELDFEKITILYGGNGSGKSTLLNLIATKLDLKRIAPFNIGETYDLYVEACRFNMDFNEAGERQKIPVHSRIITSDDIFDYMLTVRSNNEEISDRKIEICDEYAELKYGDTVRLNGLENFEIFRRQVLSRKKTLSRRKFIRNIAGSEVKLISNGETAFHYFLTNLMDDTFYCLDEPENSLSPKLQVELIDRIDQMAHYCGCQFVIATHSPFILATKQAKIYDLDAIPVTVKNWWELDSMKTYFDLFYKNRDKFFVDAPDRSR